MEKLTDMIYKQMNAIKREKLEPKYISFNLNGYGRFIREGNYMAYPNKFNDLPIICNPHQIPHEVVVLAEPNYEYLHHT